MTQGSGKDDGNMDKGPVSKVLSKRDLAKTAESELGETPKAKAQALRDLRDWIHSQGSRLDCLKGVPDEFLVRFLRVQKTDPSKAADVLDKYVTFRTTSPQWFHGLDVQDPKLQDLISRGYLFVLPRPDSQGRRVIFSRASVMDPEKFTSVDVMRAHLLTYEALLMEENCQINGVSYIFDEKDTYWAQLSIWTPSVVAKALGCSERALPIRHRDAYMISMPWAIGIVYRFARSLLSAKIRERMHTCDTIEEAKRFVPEEILPAEYGGEVPVQDMVKEWLATLEERRERILALESIRLGSDFATRILPPQTHQAQIQSRS